MNTGEAFGGAGSVDYIRSKRVPVIGSEGAMPVFYKEPMFFPQKPHAGPMLAGVLANAAMTAIPAGKTKLGTVACVEVPICGDSQKKWERWAPDFGFEPVYSSGVSIAQPDFTAECLAARNAGVQVMIHYVPKQSISRFAASCARQGFHPLYALMVGTIDGIQEGDPSFVGATGMADVFPWFSAGTPAVDEYHLAMTSVGGKEPPPGLAPPTGWVAAKLFEKAAANMPEPPTSAAVLRGLWSIKTDTLGGLTSPLTFVEDQPAPVSLCWYRLVLPTKRWESPDHLQQHCIDPPPDSLDG